MTYTLYRAAEPEAGPKAGRVAGPKAGPEAGRVAGPKAGSEAGPEAGRVAGRETGREAVRRPGGGGPEAGREAVRRPVLTRTRRCCRSAPARSRHAGLSRYPAPRRVWIIGSRPASIFRRRYEMYSSTTLAFPPKSYDQTRSRICALLSTRRGLRIR